MASKTKVGRWRLAASLLFELLTVIGCRASGGGPPPAVVAQSPAAVNDNGAVDPLAEKLRHCPLTVDGASVDVRDVDGGIEFLIRADTEIERRELIRRARHLEAFTQSRGKGTGVPHGMGQGGGWMRDCPVVTKDTLVEVAELAGGTRVTVLATGGTVEELRTESRRRLIALRARNDASAR